MHVGLDLYQRVTPARGITRTDVPIHRDLKAKESIESLHGSLLTCKRLLSPRSTFKDCDRGNKEVFRLEGGNVPRSCSERSNRFFSLYYSQIINHPLILQNGRDHEYETRFVRSYFDELMNADSVSDGG